MKDTCNCILNVYFINGEIFQEVSLLDDTVEDIFDLTNSRDISLFRWIKYILIHFSIWKVVEFLYLVLIGIIILIIFFDLQKN